MEKGYQKLFLCLGLLLVILLQPFCVKADTGPKPSIIVNVRGADHVNCYGTILSCDEYLGPKSAWNGDERAIDPEIGHDIWLKLANYKDDYYFMGDVWNLNENPQMSMGYMPPDRFKVLIYLPEKDQFYISDICEQFAFDSYYNVDVRQMIGTGTLAVSPDHQYANLVTGILVRMLFTIVVELLIALAFGLCQKLLIPLILVVNIMTQLFLNVLLKDVHGGLAALFYFGLLELGVLIMEGVIYALLMPKLSEPKVNLGKAVSYAMTANIMSLTLGLFLGVFLQ